MIVGTPRKRMSEKRRHHIFSEHCTAHHVAPCCLCGKPIHRHRDRWIVEHIRALGMLGADINTNCAPAHFACAVEKTAVQDIPRIAKAKRQGRAGAPKEKPARSFYVPDGFIYDWRMRRYVKAVTRADLQYQP